VQHLASLANFLRLGIEIAKQHGNEIDDTGE